MASLQYLISLYPLIILPLRHSLINAAFSIITNVAIINAVSVVIIIITVALIILNILTDVLIF